MPDEEKLRTALQMIPQHILRKMLDERGISFTSRQTEPIIDRLMEEPWTDSDFENLLDRLARIQREKKPYSRYIAELEAIDPGLDQSPDHERVKTVLENHLANFEGSELIEPGFEIEDVDQNSVEGIHWTKSINYSITPLNELNEDTTIYETLFRFDLDEMVLFIDCNLPAKAKSLLTKLEENGIHSQDVGHETLANPVANEYVQDFVDEFKARLSDRNPQETFGADGVVLEVDLVEILLDEAELRDVKIGGHTDIMQNPEVERFREEHDSRITRIEGEFLLEGNWYKFVTGYTDGMGNLSVKKKGRVEERPELVTQAFEFLYESYNDYFVDV